MKELKKLVEMEEAYNQEIQKILEGINVPNIDGTLNVSLRKGNIELSQYKMDEETGEYKKIYLGSDKFYIAQSLAKKQYYLSVRKNIEKRLKIYKAFKKIFDLDHIDDIYNNYDITRKSLVDPIVPTFEMIFNEWKSTPYEGLPFRPNTQKIYSKKGERVRSKSEKILADTFLDMGIEYKYECPLILEDGRQVYPDFTFLHPRTRQEIYWEHQGMMDDEKYRIKADLKTIEYEKNGIMRKDRLIVTHETKNDVLDDKWVQILIKTYLLD